MGTAQQNTAAPTVKATRRGRDQRGSSRNKFDSKLGMSSSSGRASDGRKFAALPRRDATGTKTAPVMIATRLPERLSPKAIIAPYETGVRREIAPCDKLFVMKIEPLAG